MTKPRLSPDRELFGILGSLVDTSATLSVWNKRFDKEGRDAFMDRYPSDAEHLPERLSEMFHFDRRGYIIGPALQEVIISLLDQLDASAKEAGKVDTVVNRGGVLSGYFLDNKDEERHQLWFT